MKKDKQKASNPENQTPQKQKATKPTPARLVARVQDACPVKDIIDGIVFTKDGRFVKILEVIPINFDLRPEKEQNAIISKFASVLKILPHYAQIKAVSTRPDTSEHIQLIEEDMESETDEGTKKHGEALIELLRETGKSTGVSKRFFLVIPYVEAAMSARLTTREICAELNQQAARITALLNNCGNAVVADQSDYRILSILYQILCRSESSVIPFSKRLKSVNNMYANESGYIPIADYISPKSIDAMSSNKTLKVDDLYYTFAYIPGKYYPLNVYGGWLSPLMELGDGVDLDIFIQKLPSASVLRKLSMNLRVNKVKYNESDETAADYDELSAKLQSGFYVRRGMQAGNELCFFSAMLTITAHSPQELDRRLTSIKDYTATMGLPISQYKYKPLDAFWSALPLAGWDASLFRKGRRNLLHDSLASVYPFCSYEISDPQGIFLGLNLSNRSPVYVNPFDSSIYTNPNWAILGTSGAGKTYTLLCMALRLRQQHKQVFIIAPLKGHEMRRACEAVGGSYIKISSGSGQNINIMEIRKRDDTVSRVIDGDDGKDSILAQKIQQLHVFFSLMIPDMTSVEKQGLDEALLRTYARFGITVRNKSLIDPTSPTGYKTMPTLKDLHFTLSKSGENVKRLRTILTRYVDGSAKNFSEQTNVNLDAPMVVLDVSSLTKETLSLGMFIALDYIWDKAKEDRTKSKAIFVDEAWVLIGSNASPQSAQFLLECFKTGRAYGVSSVVATQDVVDFFALDGGTYGRSILNLSAVKFCLGMEREGAAEIQKLLGLSEVETQYILERHTGTGLLVANDNHAFVQVKATSYEHDLITTNAKDLQEQLQNAEQVSSK